MLEKGRISPRQAGQLMFITIMATVVLFVPAITAEAAGHDAWLATLAGSTFGLVTLALVSWLGRKHQGKTIFQYSEDILGRWPGKLVGLLYVWIFLHMASVVVREFGDYLTTAFMPQTPLSVFNISLLLLAAMATLAGLEAIARMNEFIILLVVSFLLAVILLSLKNWEVANLLPFLARGLKPVLHGALVPASWHGEIVTLAVILPYLTRPRQAFLAGAAAVLGSAVLLTVGVIGALSVFGPEAVASFRFPLHLFVRAIDIGQVLTRFEVVVMVTWVAGVFIKTSIFYYCAALGLAQVLELAEFRPVVLPLGIIMSVFSITLFDDVTELVFFLGKTWPIYSISMFFLGLPLLLLVVTLVRGKIFGYRSGGGKKDA